MDLKKQKFEITCSRCDISTPADRTTKSRLPVGWARIRAERSVEEEGRRLRKRVGVVLCPECQGPDLLQVTDGEINPLLWLRIWPSMKLPEFLLGSGSVLHQKLDGEVWAHTPDESAQCLECARGARGLPTPSIGVIDQVLGTALNSDSGVFSVNKTIYEMPSDPED